MSIGDITPCDAWKIFPHPTLYHETDQKAHQAATSPHNDLPEPTAGQKESGDYAKGRVTIAGLPIAIENPQYSTRTGVDADGQEWSVTMRTHYGYLEGTLGADGDEVDVILMPGTEPDFAGDVYVIEQIDPSTGEFDEHKVVIGAFDEDQAIEAYHANYDDDWQGFGGIKSLDMAAFKEWLSLSPDGMMFDSIDQGIGAITDQDIQDDPLGVLDACLSVLVPDILPFPTDDMDKAFYHSSRNSKAIATGYEQQYLNVLEQAQAKALPHVETPEQQAAFDEAKTALMTEYLQRIHGVMSARSGVYSGFMAGRDKLNIGQVERRGNTFDKVSDDFNSWVENRAPSAIYNAVRAAMNDEQRQRERQQQQDAADAVVDQAAMDLWGLLTSTLPTKFAGNEVKGIGFSRDGLPSSLTIGGGWDPIKFTSLYKNKPYSVETLVNRLKAKGFDVPTKASQIKKSGSQTGTKKMTFNPDYKTITMDEWKRKSSDYKSIKDGQRYIFGMTESGAAGLIPVNVVKSLAAFDSIGSGLDAINEQDIQDDPLGVLGVCIAFLDPQVTQKAVVVTPNAENTLLSWDGDTAYQQFKDMLIDNPNPKKAAVSFFKQKLQGRFVKTKIGLVALNSKSRGKMIEKPRNTRLLIVPYIPEILLNGDIGPRVVEDGHRTDSLVAFYEFTKILEIEDLQIKARIKVGEYEHQNGYLAYYLAGSHERKNPSTNASWTEGENTQARGQEQTGFDNIQALDDDELNIEIVSIIDKKTGQPVAEIDIDHLLIGVKQQSSAITPTGNDNAPIDQNYNIVDTFSPESEKGKLSLGIEAQRSHRKHFTAAQGKTLQNRTEITDQYILSPQKAKASRTKITAMYADEIAFIQRKYGDYAIQVGSAKNLMESGTQAENSYVLVVGLDWLDLGSVLSVDEQEAIVDALTSANDVGYYFDSPPSVIDPDGNGDELTNFSSGLDAISTFIAIRSEQDTQTVMEMFMRWFGLEKNTYERSLNGTLFDGLFEQDGLTFLNQQDLDKYQQHKIRARTPRGHFTIPVIRQTLLRIDGFDSNGTDLTYSAGVYGAFVVSFERDAQNMLIIIKRPDGEYVCGWPITEQDSTSMLVRMVIDVLGVPITDVVETMFDSLDQPIDFTDTWFDGCIVRWSGQAQSEQAMPLPSCMEIGSMVTIGLYDKGEAVEMTGQIRAIKFRAGKVRYEVALPIANTCFASVIEVNSESVVTSCPKMFDSMSTQVPSIQIPNGLLESFPKFQKVAELRKYLLDKFRAIPPITNKSTGHPIAFFRSGIESSLKIKTSLTQSFYEALPLLIEHAQYVSFEEVLEGKDKPHILGYEIYQAIAILPNGNSHKVRIKVEVVKNNARMRSYYFHSVE